MISNLLKVWVISQVIICVFLCKESVAKKINNATTEDLATKAYANSDDIIDTKKSGVSIHQVMYKDTKHPDIVVSRSIGLDTSIQAYVTNHNLTHDFQFLLHHRLAFELYPLVQVSLTNYLNKMIDHRIHSQFKIAIEIGARSLGNILTHKDKVSPRIARDVLNEMGRIFLSTYRLSAAKDMFLNALNFQPYNVSVITNLAQTFFMQNNMNRSIPYLLRALEYEPKNTNIRLIVARMLTFAGNGDGGDYGKALTILANGLELNGEEACIVGAISLFGKLTKDEYDELDILLMNNHVYRKTNNNLTLYDEVQRLHKAKHLTPLLSFATYIYEKMGHTYKRLYKYIHEAKNIVMSNKKVSANSNANKRREDNGSSTKKELHLMVYFKDEKMIPNNFANSYEVTTEATETTEASYLSYESLRCMVDNILNPNIHTIHIFASNSTWVNIMKSLVFYMKVDTEYISNKLRHYSSNRKPTYKDLFHYSNTLVNTSAVVSRTGQTDDSEENPIPLVLIATNKDVQFDNTLGEFLSDNKLDLVHTRTVHVLLPWDANYISTNARGVRRKRRVTPDDSNKNIEIQGVPELKLNGFNFVGFAFKPPLAPSFVTNKKSELYIDDLMSSRAISKLFTEHSYDVASPSLKVHAHRIYGERLNVNPEKIFHVMEPLDEVDRNSNFGYLLS